MPQFRISNDADPHGVMCREGYNVCQGQAGETLTWREVPMERTVQLQVHVATVAADDRMHFVIDGVAHAPFALPETRGGQKWATVEAGEWTFTPRSEHTVVLVMDTSGISINWWEARKLLPQKPPAADAGAAVP